MPPLAWVDHFMLGFHDLDKGIAWFMEHTGVRPVIGGKHPGRGTQNAMVSLSPSLYIEIIAPDPDQPGNTFTELLQQIRGTPELITWAAATHDIKILRDKLREDKFPCEEIVEGTRKREDGSVLKWKMLFVQATSTKHFFRSATPFFIEWDNMALHPAKTSPSGCSLKSFTLHHPEAKRIDVFLKKEDFRLQLIREDETDMGLVMDSPRGLLNFRMHGKSGQ